jgi:hypothetical protein
MADITYFSGADPITRQAYGQVISRATPTLTGSSASLGTPPTNAAIARVRGTEACCITNNGADASATNGVYLGDGDVIDLAIEPGVPLRGITV